MPAIQHRRLLLLESKKRAASSPSVLPYTTGLQLWLDASNMGAFANNDPVGTWLDQSGVGNNAVQATAGLKPLYKTNQINGKPAISFDGVDDYLDISGVSWPIRDSMLFLVVKKTSPQLFNFNDPVSANNTATTLYMGYDSTSNDSILYFVGSTGTYSSDSQANTTILYGVAVDSAGNCTLYKNGVSVKNGGTITAITNTIIRLGRRQDATNAFIGLIPEVLKYTGVPTGGNQTLINNYLIAKYAIT